MWQVWAPIIFVVFVWWFTTGAVILLGRLPAATHGWSLAGATLVLIASLVALKVSSESVTTTNVVITFSAVIGIWAWHEMSFLFGYVTGHRPEPCPDWASGWTRFRFAFAALSHHELALLATFVVVVALTWGAENLYGLGAFAILWLMRITAKLNLFLGVPHFSEEVLPSRLAYLASYFRKRQVAGFFMATLILSGGVALVLVIRLVTAVDLDPAHTVGMIMLISLLVLAILEHVFMAVPFADIALWRWALIDEEQGRGPEGANTETNAVTPRRNLTRRFAVGFRTPIEACATTPTRRRGDFDNGL